jgi:hypothetical protein
MTNLGPLSYHVFDESNGAPRMTTDDTARPLRLFMLIAAMFLLSLDLTQAAFAQASSAVLGEGGPRDQQRRGRKEANAPPAPDPMAPKLKQEPLQRLDAGALLCKTEADLQQHVAAVMARLNGQEAREPKDCHLVQAMTPVSVVERHGLDRTEVQFGGQIGWTDTMIRNP